jgi:hypothetical protein
MRSFSKLSIGAALIGSVLLSFAGAAQANEWDHDHDRYDRDHRRYDHYDHHPRVVEERPIVVQRPVFVAPQPVYQAPAPSGLNLNFNIPLN